MNPKRHFLARTISIVGHPLILGNCYVVAMSAKHLPDGQAIVLAITIVLCLTVPLSIHNYRKMKKGSYTNFDVSDQQQRRGFYPVAILLLALTAAIIWLLEFPVAVSFHILYLLAMISMLGLVNFRIKASLHAALAFFIGSNLWEFGVWVVVAMAIFALGISWSRYFLRRHTVPELIIGGIIGILFGHLAFLVS
jgi:NADH:ubiquinone oxidoreductase subunit 3 (subunit A)